MCLKTAKRKVAFLVHFPWDPWDFGIFTYIYILNYPNVTKYSQYMEGFEKEHFSVLKRRQETNGDLQLGIEQYRTIY